MTVLDAEWRKSIKREQLDQHCNASFQAYDPASPDERSSESGLGLLRRADELLSSTDTEPGAASRDGD